VGLAAPRRLETLAAVKVAVINTTIVTLIVLPQHYKHIMSCFHQVPPDLTDFYPVEEWTVTVISARLGIT
jgi:hypothetical protein